MNDARNPFGVPLGEPDETPEAYGDPAPLLDQIEDTGIPGDAPLVTIDTDGKCRYATISWRGKSVKERVPLHLYKMPRPKMIEAMRDVVKTLKKKMKKAHGLDLPHNTGLE